MDITFFRLRQLQKKHGASVAIWFVVLFDVFVGQMASRGCYRRDVWMWVVLFLPLCTNQDLNWI